MKQKPKQTPKKMRGGEREGQEKENEIFTKI